MTSLLRLRNVVRPYAWGSTDFIQDLLGTPVDGEPAAELWMGAHPGAPSQVLDQSDPEQGLLHKSLPDLIAAGPAAIMGSAVIDRFGPELPFLLKVLAAERPLSIQAHPTLEQARVGYAAEDERGIARDAPTRNYVDANHKPELISALTDFDALCGFRPVDASADLLRTLIAHGAAKLAGFPERLVGDGGLRDVVTSMLTLPADWQAKLLASVLPAAAAVTTGDWAETCAWTGRLATFYPGDPGVVLALLMNLVRLRPGQALFLSAGRIHAYLRGAGVELMASSDNVLRCGLTAKHIDAPELLRVLDFSTEDVTPLNPGQDGPWSRYPVPIEDFSLNKLTLKPGQSARLHSFGPQILLVTEGEIRIDTGLTALTLARGESAFLSAGQDGTLTGHGELFLASTNIGA